MNPISTSIFNMEFVDSLEVQDPYLEYLESGLKTVELRRWNQDRYSKWRIGDSIELYNKRTGIAFRVRAIDLFRGDDALISAIDTIGWKKLMPNMKSRQEVIDAYFGFYPGDTIKQNGGMVAFTLDKIN